jgi:nucleoside-diphosphate-sugar epimerase
MTLPPLLAGQPALAVGDLDVPHAWSFTKDVARTLIAASRYTGDWGRAFHVPSQHATVNELAARFARAGGVTSFNLRALSPDELSKLAREDEFMNELVEMAYLFQRPLIIDASDTERLLGIVSSDLDSMVEDTMRKGT